MELMSEKAKSRLCSETTRFVLLQEYRESYLLFKNNGATKEFFYEKLEELHDIIVQSIQDVNSINNNTPIVDAYMRAVGATFNLRLKGQSAPPGTERLTCASLVRFLNKEHPEIAKEYNLDLILED